VSEPFQAIKISETVHVITWYGEDTYFIHRSPVWQGKWKAFSKKPLLHDDIDAELKPLLARLKAACEKAIAV
jgi:hypothetical protein